MGTEFEEEKIGENKVECRWVTFGFENFFSFF
jgi:hypothetical protein